MKVNEEKSFSSNFMMRIRNVSLQRFVIFTHCILKVMNNHC